MARLAKQVCGDVGVRVALCVCVYRELGTVLDAKILQTLKFANARNCQDKENLMFRLCNF